MEVGAEMGDKGTCVVLGGLQGTFDPVTGNFRPEFRQLVSLHMCVLCVCASVCHMLCVTADH